MRLKSSPLNRSHIILSEFSLVNTSAYFNCSPGEYFYMKHNRAKAHLVEPDDVFEISLSCANRYFSGLL